MATKRLDKQQIKRAIFLDYEGNVDKPPTLLGWRIDGETFGAIVEPLFSICEKKFKAKYVVALDHRDLIAELIERACDEKRCIVTWSQHDLYVMKEVIADSQSKQLAMVYRNALGTARPWYRNEYGATAEIASLSHFCEIFDLKVPERFGTGMVGTTLGLIRSQLKAGRRYGELTPKARKGWVAVVRHNEYDLICMERVMTQIVSRLGK
jgi:hypothetical protein